MTLIRTIDDIDIQGKRVIVRADFNVPVRGGVILDSSRIDRFLPTLSELMEHQAIPIIIAHFGRPKGIPRSDLSLQIVKAYLEENLGDCPITFLTDLREESVKELLKKPKNGDIFLLENIRFHPGEEANDPDFAQYLASLADVYVNDAFSASHRLHASIDAITRYIPSVAGRLMQQEVEALTNVLKNPKRPIMVIIAGSKVSTKFKVLTNLVKKVDFLVVGGVIANTFLNASGTKIGQSFYEKDMIEIVHKIKSEAKNHHCQIILPVDVVVAPKLDDARANSSTVFVGAIPADQMILDIGRKTIDLISENLNKCHTLIWNGPLGVFEVPPFDQGTREIAIIVARLRAQGGLYSIAGGGETVAALSSAELEDHFSYLSTAGGAFIEWLEGRDLPGIAALKL